MVCWSTWPGRARCCASVDRPPEEVEPHQRRLAALPRDRDLAVRVSGEQLLQVALQRLVRHSQTVTRVQRVLGEEEAVRAVEVADRPSWLGQQMERERWCGAKRSSEDLGLALLELLVGDHALIAELRELRDLIGGRAVPAASWM